MRCAALAESWLRAAPGGVTFYGDCSLPFCRRRTDFLGIDVMPATAPVAADAVVICDHYASSVRADIASMPRARLKVLLDDVGGEIAAGYDVIWNPNVFATSMLYPVFSGAILTGPDFVPLRSNLPRWERSSMDGSATGVLLGGGSLPAVLVDALERMAEEMSPENMMGVGSWVPLSWQRAAMDDPWRQLAKCGRVLLAAGSSMWEAACVGIPVAMVLVAENQKPAFAWGLLNGVPGVDVLTSGRGSSSLARDLRVALEGARCLPSLSNGASRVRDALLELAAA